MAPLAAEQVSGIVFDCDGLLVETESRWTKAETAMFAEHGLTYSASDKAALIGVSLSAATEYMAHRFDQPGCAAALAEELLIRVEALLRESAEAMPGAHALVQSCAARIPVALASNSPRHLVDLALASSGLADLLQITVAATEVDHSKPAPDLYLAACQRIGTDPARCVAFEDSPVGAQAARAAGMRVIAVPSLAEQYIDCDWQVGSLTDPQLLDWAGRLGSAG